MYKEQNLTFLIVHIPSTFQSAYFYGVNISVRLENDQENLQRI